ncbi:MAG: DUF3365 domain-containing protein [Thermoanaerobaculales bacterium]|nr:DUF3365 domain-containing protein [Thermoanaerobaculales bacterium]
MRGTGIVLVCVAQLWGCGAGDPGADSVASGAAATDWTVVAEADLSATEVGQLERAKAAQKELAGTLMGELKKELQAGGPASAVTVCRDLAPMVAVDVSEKHDLGIGRTSHKLRNSGNVAPTWAEQTVAEATGEKTYFRGPAGELGVMHPIRVAPPCLACHGPAESLDPTVAAALAESYPDDRAVGFAEGDLRGWFWVVVPPRVEG